MFAINLSQLPQFLVDGSSLLLFASLIKEPPVVLVLDVVDELPLSLMLKSMYSLSVEAESKSQLGFAALVELELGSPPGNNHDPS